MLLRQTYLAALIVLKNMAEAQQLLCKPSRVLATSFRSGQGIVLAREVAFYLWIEHTL
jgi:bifunctional DNase/RNase